MIKVGIIGCGLIGNKRAKVIKEDPQVALCCAADLNVFNAGGMLKQYGKGTAYRGWRDMLDKESLDVVIAATPNKHLKKIVLWAAKRKIHVLCEKPLGRNAWEAERMVKVTKENGVVLKTGFNHRHHPAIFRAHELVEDGSIGKPYFVRCVYGHGGRPGYEKEWRANKDICGGGELLDQGVHVVDLFRWFMGDFDEAFGCVPTYYWDMEVEDNAFALFRTKKGLTASMHTSWTQWKNRFVFEVFGEAGYLIVDGLGGSYGVETLTVGKRPTVNGYSLLVNGGKDMVNSYSLIVNGKENNDRVLTNPRITNQQVTNNSATRYAGGVPNEERIVFDGPDVSWELEWREFTTAIREKRKPLGSGLDGLEANRMIEAVYLSAKENRPVRLSEI